MQNFSSAKVFKQKWNTPPPFHTLSLLWTDAHVRNQWAGLQEMKVAKWKNENFIKGS